MKKFEIEKDPILYNRVGELARWLRAAKKAHTEWEAKFEGAVPEHDWEVWYAQWMMVDEGRKIYAALGEDVEITPAPIAKLQTLVGPLE